MKVVNERVKCCIEDSNSTDELKGKYIMPTLQNRRHRLACMLKRAGLLGIFHNYLRTGLTASQLHNHASKTSCSKSGDLKFGDHMLDCQNHQILHQCMNIYCACKM